VVDVATPRSALARAIPAIACALLVACSSSASSTVVAPSPTRGNADSPSVVSPTAVPTATGPDAPTPVVVIFMENHERSAVVGSGSAPYQNALLAKGRSYVHYYGVTHPSLPNYLAFGSGSTHGKTSDDITAGEIGGRTLWDQLTAAHVSWGVFAESMPSPCFLGGAAGSDPGYYALKHNPATPFASVASDPKKCAHVRPLTQLRTDVLPAVTFIAPNECSDGHSCDLTVADAWLRRTVPPLVAAGADVVIVYDEGSSDQGVGGPGGGNLYAVEVGSGVPAGVEVQRPANHYSLLAAIEDRFGVPRLGEAASAQPLPI
jgi:hypothetical protein